jgi:preprotein translocase subunit SecE
LPASSGPPILVAGCRPPLDLGRKLRAVAQFGRAPVSKTGGWGFKSLRPCKERRMNRQAKRMMQRQKATGQDRLEAMRQRRAVTSERKRRVPVRQFLKDVRQELRKVAWPTRKELVGYTIVVLVAVVFLTALVFGMDLSFSKAVLRVFQGG